MTTYYYVTRNELYHHGVKGMKWGVRRAQKKASRAERRAKAEFNKYVKDMNKIGLAGSISDAFSGWKATEIYNSIEAKKGKEYADKVQKTVLNKKIAVLATTATVALGATAAEIYLTYRNS